jgi:mono/diheme cytochrome c family protein
MAAYYRPAFETIRKGKAMRGTRLSAVLLMLALAACAQDSDQEDTAATGGEPAATSPTTETSPGGTQTAGTPPQGATAEDVVAGQQIFTAIGNCYTCHGPDAKGTALAPDLTDSEWLNIDGTFASIQTNVKNGVPVPKKHPAAMPPMGGATLTDNQIRHVSAYVWSLGGGK